MILLNNSIFKIKIDIDSSRIIYLNPDDEANIGQCTEIVITNIIGKKTFILCDVNDHAGEYLTYNGKNTLVRWAMSGFMLLEYLLYYLKFLTIHEFILASLLGYLMVVVVSIFYPGYSFIVKNPQVRNNNKSNDFRKAWFYLSMIIIILCLNVIDKTGGGYYVILMKISLFIFILPILYGLYRNTVYNFIGAYTYRLLILYSALLIFGYSDLFK